MEVLAPIIIFGVLVLISFVRKMHEQQRLEELRRRAQSSPDLEELPEATRRVIFGSPAIPSSREKYAGEEGEDEGEDEERTEATPRRVVPIPVARPYQRASGPAMRPAPGLPPGEPTVDDAPATVRATATGASGDRRTPPASRGAPAGSGNAPTRGSAAAFGTTAPATFARSATARPRGAAPRATATQA